jgi:tripartite-type tricarboxylate transporter receptor subunit TctC
MTRNVLLAITGIYLLLSTGAFAQAYPSKPIRVIQGNPAGSVVDLSARPILDEMSKRLGQPIVVDFRPGANSSIGAKAAMAAAPDGYTLFYSNVMQSNSIFNSTNAVDAGRDLLPISQFVVTPWILVARATLPATTMQELIAYSKANPGKLRNGAPAPSVTLAMAFLGARAGVQSESIPYKVSTQVLTSLLAGDIDLTLGSVTTYQAQIQAGKLRAISTMGAKRSPLLPNVPALPEVGVKDFDIPAYYGLWAPLGTPKDIIQKLSAEAVAATKNQAIVEQLRKVGAEVLGTTPEEQMRLYEYEVKFWSEAARMANYKPE